MVDDSVKIIKREAQHSEKDKKLKKGARLKDKARIRTDASSEIVLALSTHSELTLLKDSEVNLPVIEWKDGNIKEIQLIKGSLRILCSQEKCDHVIVTGLSKTPVALGDFQWNYNPQVPSVSVAVFEGEISFSGFENETTVQLKAGDSAQFVGVLENDEPAYDILLRGRKVAKGHLENVVHLSPEEIQAEANKRARKRPVARVQAAKKLKEHQICEKPAGELNQCAWSCEGNSKKSKTCEFNRGAQCVRTRCNANGEWAEKEVLGSNQQTKCGLKPTVEACDY